jgi:dolichyl-phosphate-mannose-protein mannosyltransferase
MHVETFAQQESGRLGFRLLGIYTRWSLWAFLGVAALWLLGLEGVYYHPTPFYGLLSPAFSSMAVPAVVGALVLVIFLTTRRFLSRDNAGAVWAYGALVLCIVVFASAVATQVLRNEAPLSEVLAATWGELSWHLPVIAVFSVFCIAGAVALKGIDWFGEGPSKRAMVWMLVGLVLFAVLFPMAVASLRGGPEAISAPYERHQHEYIGDIGKRASIQAFFGDYLEIHPLLSMHAKVHPPGPVAVLWILSMVIFTQGPFGLSIATIVGGALGIVPLYFWCKDMTNRRVAFTCCVLYALMPTIVLFTATSTDILFTPFTITTLFLFWRAMHRRSLLYALGAGAMYAVLSLLSFSLIGVGAFFGFVGLWRLRDKEMRRAVLQTAVVMLAAFLAVHFAVRWWSGFDVVECFHVCKAQFDTDQANLDKVTPRFPSWTWKLVNPACWFVFAGIPVSVLFLWRVRCPGQTSRGLFVVFLLTLVVFDFLYLARGEGERSAMYIMPFIALPAAHVLDELGRAGRSLAPMAATVTFLALQCWVLESFIYTYW